MDCRVFLVAAAAGDVALVDAWLSQPRADVNAMGGERWTALMYAVARGQAAVASRLLQDPAVDLNATSLCVATDLKPACRCSRL